MYAAIFPTGISFQKKKKTDSARVMRETTSIGQDVIYAQSKEKKRTIKTNWISISNWKS